MKSEENIQFVCDKLKCSREEVLVLRDDVFQLIVDLITIPQKPLTEKERRHALDIAKKYLK